MIRVLRVAGLGVLLSLAFAASASAVTLTVETTGDTSPAADDDLCSLREAISAANTNADVNGADDCDHDNGVGPDTINFAALFNGEAADKITLDAPPPQVTGVTHVTGGDCDPGAGLKPCAEIESQTGVTGMILSGANGSTVTGLAITNGSSGIVVTGASINSGIGANWFGVKLDGTVDPNSTGVTLDNASSQTLIGGENPTGRNVFANGTNIQITGSDDNVVAANYLGVLPDGTGGVFAPANNIVLTESGADRPDDNRIGGDDAGTPGVCDGPCNVISRGTVTGINVGATGTGATDTTIAGNFIGLDPGGTQDFGNNLGVQVGNADGTTVGGASAASRNYVGGSNSQGIQVGDGAEATMIRNNFLGLAASGTAAVPDTTSGLVVNADLAGTQVLDNRFGGAGAAPAQGLLLSNAIGATVRGNTFGLGTGGQNLAVPLAIRVLASDSNAIGGTGVGEGNVIVNGDTAVQILQNSDSNAVLGNLIGTDGTAADLGVGAGIQMFGPAASTQNTIGGTVAAAQNVISNTTDPIVISHDGTDQSFDQNTIGQNRGSGNTNLFIDLRLSFGGTGFGNSAAGPNAAMGVPVIQPNATSQFISGDAVGDAVVNLYRTEKPAGSSPSDIEFVGTTTASNLGFWTILCPADCDEQSAAARYSATQADPLGNSGELSQAVAYVIDPADTQIDSGPPKKTKKRRPKVTFSSPDEPDGATFECRVDSGDFEDCDSPFKPPRLAKNKRHKIFVKASDAAGNADPDPAKVKFRVLG